MNNKEQNENVSYEYNTSLAALDISWSLNSVGDVSLTSIKKWLDQPMVYNKELRILSRKIYGESGIYTNVIDYTTSLPTLDRVLFSVNKESRNFQKNKTKFAQALKTMKDKIITRDMLLKLAIDGVYFAYFETHEGGTLNGMLSNLDIDAITEINSDVNCSVLPLPTDYCRIIGRKNSSYVIAFDLSYFDQYRSNGLSSKLKRYPKEIRDGYRKYVKERSKNWLVLDNSKTIALKVRANIEEPWGRPLGLASFVDIMYDQDFLDTKRNTLKDVNSAILYQTFPEGENKGTSSLSQKQQREQHDNIRNALFARRNRQGINFFSIASGTKLDQIKVDVDILKTKAEDELIKRISTGLGFAGSALNGQDGNFSSQQTNLSLIASELFNWMEQIVDEYNKVINLNVIKDRQCFVELYYLPITHVNRKEFFGYMKDLYSIAGGSKQALIAASGINPDAYLAMMDEEIEMGFSEKYKPHQTSYTMSGKESSNESGAPEIDDPTSENTIKSRTNNSNANPRA